MNENFETLFENSKYSQDLTKGQIVQADVIDITSDHAILNSGLKSESVVAINQFKDTEGEIEIKIGDFKVAEKGRMFESIDEKKIKEYMEWESITIEINLKIGQAYYECYTCDFTKDYIDINADYRS